MCSIEGCKYPSINKKYDLCNEHNYIRLNGRSRQEVYSERALSKPTKAPYKFKINTGKVIRQQTSKEASVKQKLSALKIEIELEAIHENEYYCKGCGESHPGLDKSHILSVGQFKHLELVKANIQLMCRTCHMKWESWDIEMMAELNCFEDNLEFIRIHSREFFMKIWHLMREYSRLELTSDALKKIQNILKKVGEKVAR